MKKPTSVLIAIDNDGFVVVPAEKKVLVIEIIKHFTPEWQNKANTAIAEGKSAKALGYVHAMLNRLNVQNDVLPMPDEHMYILDPNQSFDEPEEMEATPNISEDSEVQTFDGGDYAEGEEFPGEHEMEGEGDSDYR